MGFEAVERGALLESSRADVTYLDPASTWRDAGQAMERLALALRIPHGPHLRDGSALTVGGTTVRVADLLDALASLVEKVDG